MDAETIAKKARKSISSYCHKECRSYCCRKGYLILNHKEMKLVTKEHKIILEENKVLVKVNPDKYSLYMGDYNFPCPSLGKDFRCTIHKKKDRPDACKKFPVFVERNIVRLSERCLAVRAGKLYPFIALFKSIGCNVILNKPLEDIEQYKHLPQPVKLEII